MKRLISALLRVRGFLDASTVLVVCVLSNAAPDGSAGAVPAKDRKFVDPVPVSSPNHATVPSIVEFAGRPQLTSTPTDTFHLAGSHARSAAGRRSDSAREVHGRGRALHAERNLVATDRECRHRQPVPALLRRLPRPPARQRDPLQLARNRSRRVSPSNGTAVTTPGSRSRAACTSTV